MKKIFVGVAIAMATVLATSVPADAKKAKKGKVEWADFASMIDEAANGETLEHGVWSTSQKKFLTSEQFLSELSQKDIILAGAMSGWKPGPMRGWLLEELVQLNGPYALVNGSIGEKDIPKIDKAQKQLKGRMFNYTIHYNKKNSKAKLSSRASFEQPLLQVRADHDLPLFAGYYPEFDAREASKHVSSESIIKEATRMDQAFCYMVSSKDQLVAQAASNVGFGTYYKPRMAEYQSQLQKVFITDSYGVVSKDFGLPDMMPEKASEMASIAIMETYQGTIDARGMSVADPFSSSKSQNGQPKYDYIWIWSVKSGEAPKTSVDCESIKRRTKSDPHAPWVFTEQDIRDFQNSPKK